MWTFTTQGSIPMHHIIFYLENPHSCLDNQRRKQTAVMYMSLSVLSLPKHAIIKNAKSVRTISVRLVF